MQHKAKSIAPPTIIFIILFAVGGLYMLLRADAATSHTWRGGTGVWSDPGNWDTGSVPASGDSIVIDFDAFESTTAVAGNDIDGLQLASIHLTGGTSASGTTGRKYRILGNDLALSGAISSDANSEGSIEYSVGVVLAGDLQVNTPQIKHSFDTDDDHKIVLNGHTITFSSVDREVSVNQVKGPGNIRMEDSVVRFADNTNNIDLSSSSRIEAINSHVTLTDSVSVLGGPTFVSNGSYLDIFSSSTATREFSLEVYGPPYEGSGLFQDVYGQIRVSSGITTIDGSINMNSNTTIEGSGATSTLIVNGGINTNGYALTQSNVSITGDITGSEADDSSSPTPDVSTPSVSQPGNDTQSVSAPQGDTVADDGSQTVQVTDENGSVIEVLADENGNPLTDEAGNFIAAPATPQAVDEDAAPEEDSSNGLQIVVGVGVLVVVGIAGGAFTWWRRKGRRPHAVPPQKSEPVLPAGPATPMNTVITPTNKPLVQEQGERSEGSPPSDNSST